MGVIIFNKAGTCVGCVCSRQGSTSILAAPAPTSDVQHQCQPRKRLGFFLHLHPKLLSLAPISKGRTGFHHAAHRWYAGSHSALALSLTAAPSFTEQSPSKWQQDIILS